MNVSRSCRPSKKPSRAHERTPSRSCLRSRCQSEHHPRREELVHAGARRLEHGTEMSLPVPLKDEHHHLVHSQSVLKTDRLRRSAAQWTLLLQLSSSWSAISLQDLRIEVVSVSRSVQKKVARLQRLLLLSTHVDTTSCHHSNHNQHNLLSRRRDKLQCDLSSPSPRSSAMPHAQRSGADIHPAQTGDSAIRFKPQSQNMMACHQAVLWVGTATCRTRDGRLSRHSRMICQCDPCSHNTTTACPRRSKHIALRVSYQLP